MDRNCPPGPLLFLFGVVALRKESVDRNVEEYLHAGGLDVALRKESVDRNYSYLFYGGAQKWSLSARRAWIEIENPLQEYFVAMSLSARRAWIEIHDYARFGVLVGGRSPQGERG